MSKPASLHRGDRGEEVRRLQHNLNYALRNHHPTLVEDGIFGPKTYAAVLRFQKEFRLNLRDGVVGPETRGALATRVLIIDGNINRTPDPAPGPRPNPTVRDGTGPQPSPTPVTPNPQPGDPPPPRWLMQGQPALIWTPPPFWFHDPSGGPAPGSVFSAAASLGFVYRTATEGPHWEFGGAGQFAFNSRNQPTDPRYTAQLQGQVSYVDPWSSGRFHSALFAQAAGLYNIDPGGFGLNLGLGGQVSVDIIADRWNLFAQGVLAGQWALSGPSSGQLMLVPGLTLGSTVQWEFPFLRSR